MTPFRSFGMFSVFLELMKLGNFCFAILTVAQRMDYAILCGTGVATV